MTQSEFEKALAVLYRQRTVTVRREALSALTRIMGEGEAPRGSKKSSSSGAQVRRRSSAEVKELSEKLFEMLERHPGASMMELAEKLGSSSRELERPMALLKRMGQVRTTGSRNHMKYYPMARA